MVSDADNSVTVGQLLKNARLAKNIELSAIAQSLCIRQYYLEKIEQDTLSDLPSDMYAVGFIRSYARYLELDDDALVEKLRAQSSHILEKPSLMMPTALPEVGVPTVRLAVIATSIALLVLLVATQLSFKDLLSGDITKMAALEDTADRAPVVAMADMDDVPSAPNMLTGARVTMESSAQQEAPAAQADIRNVSEVPVEKVIEAPAVSAPVERLAETPAQSLVNNITLKAIDMSWVEIKDPAGAVIYHKVMQAGDTFTLPSHGTLQLRSGNAGGLVFVKADKESAPLGHMGEVIKDVPLSAHKVLADYF